MTRDPFWTFMGCLAAALAGAAVFWAVSTGKHEHLIFSALFAGVSRLYFREFRV